MAVADEHGVEVFEQLGQHRLHLASHGAEPLAQDRVGEDPQVVDLDQHRRVAEERQPPVASGAVDGRRRRAHGAPPLVDVRGPVRHLPMVPHPARAGLAAAGILADVTGIRVVFAVGGAVALLAAVVAWSLFRGEP